ncbi:PREDICTED: E3 ubiquitin-protein ligase TRIM71-like [Amphimedon queenslandica]|uniref:RING-type domain-containing protein n=1 Tax=Amphimedon queenslandica TaxID=400682 RepID=A0A1X7TLR2_AMPQE|nr:PREDICTED: E3 ubiquitin-protein ligase TRIM71-like [Amphimedon queenslandica]|eukprot:XP_011407248.1 PREDICTED: E3 ubiquitin-protein ligase TRIM71-like [Amphimedon queenslandica]
MANNEVEIQEPIPLVCGLCSEYYTDPLILPCLHSFCMKCLVKIKEEQGREESLKCPTCDANVPLPSGKVKGLTQNLWLAHKVLEATVREKISSKDSIPCDQCTSSSDDASVAFCCSCCLFLCDFCKKGHKRMKKTVHHELIELGGKKIGDVSPVVSRQPTYCAVHDDEKIKFFCQDCEMLVCRDCFIVTHKDHNRIEYTEEGDAAREALKESAAKCHEAKVSGTFFESIANGEEMLRQIDTRKEEIEKEIEETFTKLKTILEERRRYLLAETEEIASAKKESVKKQLNEFQRLENGVLLGCQLAQSVSECVDSGEVLSIKKLITDQLERCLKASKEHPREIQEDGVILTKLEAVGISNEINGFGGVFEVDPDRYSIESGLAIPLATVGKQRKFKLAIDTPLSLDKATAHLKTSFVKCDGTKEEGKVVIANDNKAATISCTPQSIGQYLLSVTVRGHHIKSSPYGLSAKASKNYASLPNLGSYNVGNYTYGVAVHTNGDVFASDSSNGFVQVFSQDRNKTRTIGTKGNGDGQFQSPFGLLVVGDKLYVSDNSLHRLQYFSAITGKYIGQFGTNGNGKGQFSNPYGMASDGKGKILVADYSNSRVQVFEEDGTFVQVIQCNGTPAGVAVDNDGNIHVTIYNQHYVQVFPPEGTNQLYTYNNPNGYLNYPTGIAIDDEGYIFILSRYSSTNYLNVLSPQRTQVNLISQFHNSSTCYGMALDKDGHIYVPDYYNRRIMKY